MAHPIILWDASGLVKHYYAEPGAATVDAIFAAVASRDMAVTPWGYAETYAILLRRYNSAILRPATFRNAVASLRSNVLGRPSFTVLSITDALIFGSLSLMQAHNINSADAAILATYLRFQRSASEPCLLAASDKRLLRAAEAEGLPGLNPEEVAPDDVPGVLSQI